MRETLYDYCIRTARDALLDQWDAAANQPLTSQNVTYGSTRRVWWRCRRDHRWSAPVYLRTGSDTDCPYCAGKRPWPGETDLETCYPHLAREWHPTRNGDLSPRDVLPGSHRKVWWVCPQGHTWEAMVKSRTAGSGCPVCTSRALGPGNSLADTYPELAAQWHPTKNGPVGPGDTLPGSTRRVWWCCDRGHAWQARVFSRTGNGTGCPYCAGKLVRPGENDLATLFPEIAAQWYTERNGPQGPELRHAYSNSRVWWRCDLGHGYQATIAARTMHRSGCPYCANRKVLPGFNDLATREPKVAAQWHPRLNGALTADMVTVGSARKVWWICAEGHVWKAVISSRTGPRKHGCPVCAGNVKKQHLTPV